MEAKAKEKHIQNGMDASDSMIADKAMEATRCAYARALQLSSQGVLRIKSGDLVRVLNDGSTTLVRKAKPHRKVTVGQVVTVRSVKSQTAGHSA
ncbi:MAG TPA: hypothetical protein VGE28_00140 [Pseudomonas sp.]